MKRIALALMVALAGSAHAQFTPRFVVFDDYVRAVLARDWDAGLRERPMVERAYCAGHQLDVWAGEPAYRITQIVPALTLVATPEAIRFTCPKTAGVVELHVHPPQTCLMELNTCFNDGPYAYQCLPSDVDLTNLRLSGRVFGLVQCDRKAIVAFWP